MTLAPGSTLGQYEVRSPLGAGGMGEVYRAHDKRLGRDVAIKVLPEYLTSDPDRLRRFELEARATAALNHPNILGVYEMDTHGSVSYLVEELLDGETLRERLRSGTIPLRKAIDYGVQIAHGLAAAHDKGIVHRDLKPENLFVTKDGRVKILDFGLARLTQPKETSGFEATQAMGTEPGMVMGTAGYMSPEQVRGKAADHRADIFAFGAILYEMVTGKQTFHKATSAETMTAILNEEPPSISQLTPTTPPGMQRVVHRCLEKGPEQRFHSAHDLAFALEALSDSTITSVTGTHAVQEGGSNRSRIALAVGAGLLALLVVAGLVYYFMQPSAPPKLSNAVKLTSDGQSKWIVGTEGSRLYLSYVSRDAAGLVEMPTTGGEPNKLPFTGNSNLYPLTLSPDGSQFLMVDGHGVRKSGPLWSVPVLGGSPRPLADVEGYAGAWSPDGKLLAYSLGNSLFVANADGRDPRKVVSMKDAVYLFSIAWSPDGSRLRFAANEYYLRPARFWDVSVDGTGLHRLHPERPDLKDECCGAWTADGKYFLFWSNGQIWGLAKKSRFIGPEPKPIQLTSSLMPLPWQRPIPSTDGKKVFVVGRTLRGELVRYNSQSGGFESFLGGISAEQVEFSRDGQWMVYVTFPDQVLWRSKVDGSERLQLTYPPSHPFTPHWSPDGKTIAFFDARNSKDPKIYTVSSQGGNSRPLLPDDPSPQTDPSWSPEGSKIIFSSSFGDPSSSIKMLDLAKHELSTLPGSQGFSVPRWSPNGRYVCAENPDLTTLLIFDFQTQKWTEVAKGSLGWPSFTKDSQYLYFTDASETGSVMRVRISDLRVERVADLKNVVTVGQIGSWFAPTPDGSIMLLRDAGTSDVYSLDWQEP